MFCPQFAPLVGGAERQAEKLGKALRLRGVDVRVLTLRLRPDSPAEEVLDGLPVHRFPLSDLSSRFPRLRGIGLVNAPWIALQIGWRVWREARNADLVHCHIGCLPSIAAAWGARMRGRPAICKAAMADDRSDLGETAKSGLTGRVVAWVGKRAFNRWVATTQAVKDALLRAGVKDSHIAVIPNGVEVPEGTPRDVQHPVRRFLYLGRLSTNTQRDVPTLIQAFDCLADDMRDVELAVVGGGDLLEATRGLVAKCRHADRIRVPGQGDANEWLAWADCFVLPSRREGLSNALLEAMAAGLPCIANDIPPNREVLDGGEFGLLVPVESAAELCEAMSLLAESGVASVTFRQAGRQRIEQCYSINQVVTRYIALYENLLSERHVMETQGG